MKQDESRQTMDKQEFEKARRIMDKQEFEEARRIMNNLGKAETSQAKGNLERPEVRAIMDDLKREESREMLDDLERDLLEACAIIETVAFCLDFAGHKPKDISGSLAICADRASKLVSDCVYKIYELQDAADGLMGASCGG